MQTRMMRYHKQQGFSWGYLAFSAVPAVVVILLMFSIDAETLRQLALAIFLMLSIVGLIFVGMGIIDRITGKNDRKVEITAIGLVLSVLFLVLSYRTICNTDYSEKGDLIINVFQKRRLNETAGKFQHIKRTLKNNNSLPERKVALRELDEISSFTLKNTQSLKGQSSLKESINELRDGLRGDSGTFVEVNLLVVAASYSYAVFTEHYTDQQLKQDKARTVDTFFSDAGVKL